MSNGEPAMTDSDIDSIETLVTELASKDVIQRTTARQRLVKIGKPTLTALTAALVDPRKHVRWEAAKTLAAIADPGSVLPLIEALQDEEGDVRWVVGEALIALGPDAIVPVLKGLCVDPDNPAGLYGTAHQVLHALVTDRLRPVLTPVLAALKHADREVKVPVAAEEAIEALASTR
jgi:HEAT repeat protein